MRKSTFYFCFMLANMLILALMFSHSRYKIRTDMPTLMEKAEMVRELGLTDLCLFTEASYTRHLSQTDLQTPFQDYPMSFEHFPTGSLLAPPDRARNNRDKHD